MHDLADRDSAHDGDAGRCGARQIAHIGQNNAQETERRRCEHDES